MQVVATGVPPDDCRVKLQRVSDNVVLASLTLVDKDNLGGITAGITMTNLPTLASVVLENGEQYRIYCESTNATGSNRYNVQALWGVDTDDIPAGTNSLFQGTDSYQINSVNELTWVKYGYVSGKEVDAGFELHLEPLPKGTLIVVQ